MNKLLLVAPNRNDFDEHIVYLRSQGFDFDYEKSDGKILQRIEQEGFSGVIFMHRKEWNQGITLCSDIKKQTKIPVFMVSKQRCDKAALHMIQEGIFYFPEGTTPLYVSSIIRMYLEERVQQKKIAKEVDKNMTYDIEVNESTGQIFVGGKQVKCVGKTYELWLYLLKQGDSYTSEEEIYHNVWKSEALPGYKNTIRVYIKKIRDCIPEHMKDVCFVENARGIGYRFVGRYRMIKSVFFLKN